MPILPGSDAVTDQTTFVETINPVVGTPVVGTPVVNNPPVTAPVVTFTSATDPVTTSTRFATLSVLATDTASTGEAGPHLRLDLAHLASRRQSGR